jgi:hypothetical protein
MRLKRLASVLRRENDGSSQGSNSKQQAETPLLGCAHLKFHDLRYRENEDDDVFDNAEDRTADPNGC